MASFHTEQNGKLKCDTCQTIIAMYPIIFFINLCNGS